MELLRYRFAVVEWYNPERTREFQVLTDQGVHKAAWMAGSTFTSQHPETPVRTLRLMSEVDPTYDANGVVVVEPEDLRDLIEWR